MVSKLTSDFLKRFLPVAALILLAGWFYERGEDQRLLSKLESQETVRVSLSKASVLRQIDLIAGDLAFMAEHYAVQKLVNDPSSPEIFRLEKNLQSLVKTRQVYGQARWIDAQGQEKVRVDLVNGEPILIPRENLQNKADRYYVAAAMQKKDREIYISPLDLNVERGEIETPFKPVLRLAVPVADQHGIKQGILIFNYLAEGMLKGIHTDAGNDAHVSLLNSEGYWLHSPNAGDAWGFMFKDSSRTLASRSSAAWARMQADSGQFRNEDGLWTYERVYPLGKGSDYHWVVLAHLDPARIAEAMAQSDVNQTLFVAALILLSGIGLFKLQQTKALEQASNNRFAVVFDYAMVGIATIAADRGWLTVNPALCRILGYDAEELRQKAWTELTHPEDRENETKRLDQVARGESDGYSLEKRFIHKDGSVIHAFVSARAVRTSDGRVDYYVAIIEDVSTWVLAEQQWGASVNTLQRFIDHLPGMAYVKDADGELLLASRQDKLIKDLIKEKSAEDQRVLSTGLSEVQVTELDGRCYESTKFAIPRIDGAADLGAITLDITERQRTQEKLAQQIRRSAVLLEMPVFAEQLTEQAFMKYALERAEELTGSLIGFMHFVNDDETSIELVAWSSNTLEKYCTASFDSHYPIAAAGIWADAAREKRPVVFNDYATAPNKHGLPDGHSALLRLLSIPVMEGGKVRMMTGVGNKAVHYSDYDVETVQLIGNETWRIVQRKRAEDSLHFAAQVVNASPTICFRWAATEGWPVTFVSENIQQWGYTAEDIMAGRPPYADLVHPDDLQRVAGEVAASTASGICSYEQEYRILTKSNDVIWVSDVTNVHRNDKGEPDYFDGVLTDITERKQQQLQLTETLSQQKTLNKRLEEAHNQLLQSEKMASIGQLAAGVAHELNNPIGFVHSNLGTLDGYVHDLMAIFEAYESLAADAGDSPQRRGVERLIDERDFAFLKSDIFNLLAESRDGLGRVRKIVQDLKSFSRVGEQEWKEADLHQGLDSTLNIVWNELKYKARVVKEYGEIPPVFCLVSQLNQVFMNILVNAGHAIEGQGVITIRTRCDGDSGVCVEICDTGRGIAPEHLNRIFDPFFTTKPVGTGTGLGLSLSYSIIERHKGRIEVESEVGVGSTFRILLPVHPQADHSTHHPETS